MSCSDVQTIKAGNGSQLTFSFDFPYIFKSEIHVYFWNATTKEYDEKLTTDSTYPWRITDANPTIVEFTSTAPPAPATPVDPGESAVDNVKIRRITKVDDIRALFNPGSAIRSDDLNKNFEQLRYAIQEANCQGIPDDVDQYLKDYYWDRYDNTLYNGDTWVSDDTKIATTAALDARFQDEVNDTLTKAELAAASNTMPDDDVAVPTTGSLKNYVDHVVETDILVNSTGLTKTATGGQVTLGIGEGSVDLDRIKPEDIITYSEQNAGSPSPADSNIFTASAAARRFDTIVQTSTPSGSDWQVGKTWLQNDADKTLSVWDGDSWEGISSGGTFTSQAKVVYVDATNGNDANDGHRISRPKATIKNAIDQINNDATYGDGSIVVVAPGVYQEACPIQIQKRDVAIVGTSLRQCVIHPTAATETATMFEVNSGSYLKNLTFTGMKASGTRGATGSLWENATYGLPPTQGWNVAFYNNAYIYKSPYIQNCTNFSDSEIDNTNLDFYAGDADKGRAGDLDSAPTGGGLLVDGSTPHQDSPLRSIVCDSYTHTGLDAPGIFVTNNGYVQATSSYAFFNHAHITCINGGQANLAASTSDFGRYGLIASGKSSTAIFTSTIDGAVSDGAISFNIDAPTAGAGWHGSATRPAGNQLVTVNSVTYPILSAVANGSGWTVTISRPDPNNRSTNLGVNGAISDGAAVSFFLRSMIASSGHTMEYVGSGTNYTALPENGGVPNDANQKIELDNGKIWTATTDQNGKFTVGGNQTDDPFFEVDQQRGFVTIPEGSIAFNLLSDLTPQLGGNLDVNGQEIVTDAGNENIVLNPHGTGAVNVSSSKIINVTNPTDDQDAATKKYVDDTVAGIDEVVEDATPQLGGNLDVNGNEITSTSDGNVTINPNGTGNIVLDANVGIGTSSPASDLHVKGNDIVQYVEATGTAAEICFRNNTSTGDNIRIGGSGNNLTFDTGGSESARIDSDGNVGIGTTSPLGTLSVGNHANTAGELNDIYISGDKVNADGYFSRLLFKNSTQSGGSTASVRGERLGDNFGTALTFYTQATGSAGDGTERMRIDNSGRVGIGVTSPGQLLHIEGSNAGANIRLQSRAFFGGQYSNHFAVIGSAVRVDTGQTTGMVSTETSSGNGRPSAIRFGAGAIEFHTAASSTAGAAFDSERMRIDSSGRVGIGTSSPATDFHIHSSSGSDNSEILLTNGDTGATATDGFKIALNSGEGGEIWNYENDYIRFGTNNTERMRIDSEGKTTIQGSGTSNNPFEILTLKNTETSSSGQSIQINLETNRNNQQGVSKVKSIASDNSGTAILQFNSSQYRFKDQADTSTYATIDSSGNVGIGTSSPRALVDFGSGSGDGTLSNTLSEYQAVFEAPQGTGDIARNIGFAVTTTGISAAINATDEGTGNATGLMIATGTAGSISERMRIDSSGRLMIGTTSSISGTVQVKASSDTITTQTTASVGATNATAIGFKNNAGTYSGAIYVNGSSTTYNTSSDYRLKENVVDITDGITRVKQLQPKRFNFIVDADTTVDGFLAHEAQAVVPEAVTGTHNEVDDDGNAVMQGIDQSKLVPLLTAALQEAIAKIETLEAKVAALEAG